MINLLLLFFCSHILSLVELESVIAIVATAPYFEHTAPLSYSLWLKVILTSRIKAMGEKAVQELNQISGLQNNVIYHQLDIGDRESILSLRKFIEASMEKWGFKGLDILVNNAGEFFTYHVTKTPRTRSI